MSITHLVPRTERVTPELAQQWLQKQFGDQRKLRDHHALLLAGEMQRGAFVPHNAISFAVLGQSRYLIDGQHRLQAVTLYGKPVSMSILEIPAADMEHVRQLYSNIDQGLRRTTIDAIRAMGIANEFSLSERRVQRMAGALRVIATRFTDTTGGASRSESRKKRAVTRSNAVNTTLLRAWNREIHRYYGLVEGGEPSIIELFDRAAVLGCALLTIRYAPDQAERFWRDAVVDDGLSKADPRKRFVAWLREGNTRKSGDIGRAFAVAWRHFLRSSEVTFLRVNARSPLEIEGIDLDQV